ncbi:unnamed protein product [Caenorhabditis angaria]|uniref:Metallothionein n=1 Tax=Caenorhabditis angaria TaxID=860376 RepID=A0A9P1IRD4_9PELO|nr:unnamed protein product [Caenorhabditis angaria]
MPCKCENQLCDCGDACQCTPENCCCGTSKQSENPEKPIKSCCSSAQKVTLVKPKCACCGDNCKCDPCNCK